MLKICGYLLSLDTEPHHCTQALNNSSVLYAKQTELMLQNVHYLHEGRGYMGSAAW